MTCEDAERCATCAGGGLAGDSGEEWEERWCELRRGDEGGVGGVEGGRPCGEGQGEAVEEDEEDEAMGRATAGVGDDAGTGGLCVDGRDGGGERWQQGLAGLADVRGWQGEVEEKAFGGMGPLRDSFNGDGCRRVRVWKGRFEWVDHFV